ncbi:MAG: hypothetical protein AAGI46_06260 [Planctomycetota bacterium]
MKMQLISSFAALALAVPATAQVVTLDVDQDYMSSGFFFGPDFLRGQEDNSTRATNRATSNPVFGVNGETAYFSFDFDPSAFSGPVQSAVFRSTTVAPGFGLPEASVGDPAVISLHSLTADPLATVDLADASTVFAFRDAQITTSSIVATESITSLGLVEFDVTGLINTWIADAGATFDFTIGSSALLDQTEAAVAFVNSSFTGLLPTDVAPQLVITVPEPATASLVAVAGLIGLRRRR